MPVLHVANASFEEEIEKGLTYPEAVHSHPMYLQLQFLPFLYGGKEDLVYATATPDEGYFARLKALGIAPLELALAPQEGLIVNCWGITPAIMAWAKKHRLALSGPPPEMVGLVTSKAFSFANSPKLEGSALLKTQEELVSWAAQFSGKKVLKSCFGVSGKGHFHLNSLDDPSLAAFTKREWAKGLPLIAEPWVDRLLDFSTQWYLHEDGRKDYLGFTICENDAKGHYLGTLIGAKEPAQFDEHMRVANSVLDMMKHEGYFGHVGFDAMLYGNQQLQPIVEINARKTMGWVALAIQKRHFPGASFALRLTKKTQVKASLLPISVNGTFFQRQLFIDFLDK